MCVIETHFFLGRIVSTHSTRRRLSDAYETICRLSDAYETIYRLSDAYETIRCLSDTYETSRRLSDAYGHIYKKKIIFVILRKFKKRNPRAVGFFRRILDRNVVVSHRIFWPLSWYYPHFHAPNNLPKT